jgi:effector-binding domain-containing protein
MYWDLQTANDSTVVTWGIKGRKNFSQKIHWLLNGGIETSIEPMLKDGLALLNEKLLEEMDIHAVEYKGIVDYGGGYYLYQTVACKINDVPKKMGEMFPEIINYMTINNIEASGKPFTLNHQIDTINNTVMFSTCIPIKERIETESNVLTGYLEPLSTYKIIFKGNYKFLPAEWPNFYKNLNKDGYTPVEKGFSFEVYTINPQDNQNPAEWLTEIYIPIKIEEINDTTTETNQTNL